MSTIKFNARDLDGALTHVNVESKDIKLITVEMMIEAITDKLSNKPFTVRLWNPKENKQVVKGKSIMTILSGKKDDWTIWYVLYAVASQINSL